MKRLITPRNQGGFAGMPAVALIALILTLSLLFLFRVSSVNQDQAAKTQLRADYHQREEALLRAVVAVTPQRAIDCMKADYGASAAYSWATIFNDAIDVASVNESLPAGLLATLGLTGARRGDVGDAAAGAITITSLEKVEGQVTPGTTDNAGVFAAPEFAGKVPPLLDTPAALQAADKLRPVVSPEKQYSTQDGLLADVDAYPIYNLISYPNIRFGYAAPGEPFVAKRNWWAFSVTYGAAIPGAPVVTKNYVLSLYEIPTQLPIEGAAYAEIGTHEDDSAWTGVTIDGGVYANEVAIDQAFGTNRISAKESIAMAGGEVVLNDGSLEGVTMTENFDAPGVREQLQAERKSDVLPVAVSANSGRLTFVPINRGAEFLQDSDAPNAWEDYSRGAEQGSVIVDVIDMESLESQTPTAIRVRFLDGAGDPMAPVELRRGENWPTEFEEGGDTIPFQTELTTNAEQHKCLKFFPSVLDAWIVSQGGASVATTNNSVAIRTDPTEEPLKVRPTPDPASPPDAADMAVLIRKGNDLRSFTEGLSIVTPHRVYIGDDLNATPADAVPAGSGLADDAVFFPPLSIFSLDLRIGTTDFVRPLEHHGRLGTLGTLTTEADPWRPLDIKSGSDDAVHGDSIDATLTELRSPAELPPVHQINWLVTIEEIPQD